MSLVFRYSLRCVLLLTVAFASAASAQEAAWLPAADARTLDALIEAGRFDEASEIVARLEARTISNATNDTTQATGPLAPYRRAIDAVARLLANDADFRRSYAEQWTSQSTLYTDLRAGERASRLFSQYGELVQSGFIDDAIRRLEAARLFKARYTAQLVPALIERYARAETAYDAEDYASARHMVDSTRVFFGDDSAPYFSAVAPFIPLDQALNRVAQSEAQQERNWRRTEQAAFRATFVVTGTAAFRSDAQAGTLRSENGSNVEFDESRGGSDLFYGGEALVHLTKTFALGFGGSYGTYAFDNENDATPISTAFEANRLTLYAAGRYLLRTTVGARPYVRIGAGWARVEQQSGTVSVRNFGQLISRFDTLSDEQSGGILLGGIGVEYVPCVECALTFAGEVGGARLLFDAPFVPRSHAVATVRLGFNL